MSPLAFWWNLRLRYFCAIFCHDAIRTPHSHWMCLKITKQKTKMVICIRNFDLNLSWFWKLIIAISIEIRMSLEYLFHKVGLLLLFTFSFIAWRELWNNTQKEREEPNDKVSFIYTKCVRIFHLVWPDYFDRSFHLFHSCYCKLMQIASFFSNFTNCK